MAQRREDQSFWISYSDLASGLMIAFLLIMLIMVVISKRQTEVQREQVKEVVDQIQVILGTKARLAEALKPAIGNLESGIRVDPVTAQLVLDQTLIEFEREKAALDLAAMGFLNRFTMVYLCALWSAEDASCTEDPDRECGRLDPTRPQGVRRILVTGHADLVGSSDWNHKLSAARAEEVVQYMRHVLRCSAEIPSLGDVDQWRCSQGPSLELPAQCLSPEGRMALWEYGQERLYGVGAGDLEHCRSTLAGEHGRLPSPICYDHRALAAGALEENSMRKVTFELEITGSDMTGLLIDVLELRNLVGTDAARHGEQIDGLAQAVADGCWGDPDRYHGCEDFIRHCLGGVGGSARWVGGIDCAGFLAMRDTEPLYSTVRRICQTGDPAEPGAPITPPGCEGISP